MVCFHFTVHCCPTNKDVCGETPIKLTSMITRVQLSVMVEVCTANADTHKISVRLFIPVKAPASAVAPASPMEFWKRLHTMKI